MRWKDRIGAIKDGELTSFRETTVLQGAVFATVERGMNAERWGPGNGTEIDSGLHLVFYGFWHFRSIRGVIILFLGIHLSYTARVPKTQKW